jgi:hypothetical protein
LRICMMPMADPVESGPLETVRTLPGTLDDGWCVRPGCLPWAYGRRRWQKVRRASHRDMRAGRGSRGDGRRRIVGAASSGRAAGTGKRVLRMLPGSAGIQPPAAPGRMVAARRLRVSGSARPRGFSSSTVAPVSGAGPLPYAAARGCPSEPADRIMIGDGTGTSATVGSAAPASGSLPLPTDPERQRDRRSHSCSVPSSDRVGRATRPARSLRPSARAGW